MQLCNLQCKADSLLLTMSTYLQYKGAVLATGSKRGQGEETAEVEEVFFFFNST